VWIHPLERQLLLYPRHETWDASHHYRFGTDCSRSNPLADQQLHPHGGANQSHIERGRGSRDRHLGIAGGGALGDRDELPAYQIRLVSSPGRSLESSVPRKFPALRFRVPD